MGVLASRPFLAKTIAAMLVLLTAVVAHHVYGFPCHRPAVRPRTCPSPVEEGERKQRGQGRAVERHSRQKGLLKGPVPQKSDLFIALVCKEFPSISGDEARRRFPRKFEAHGHVVVARLNAGVTLEEFKPLAKAFAESFAPINVDVVLLDSSGIVGELRHPKLEVLYAKHQDEIASLQDSARAITKRWREARGKSLPTCVPEEDLRRLLQEYTQSVTYTVHVENGVRYGFDVNKVMFSSGNTTERMHFAAINAKGEVVVDMFVGIGYFTLPLAMHGEVSVIYALDKNPDSVAFVRLNAVLNRVDHLIQPQCGDNRLMGNEVVGQCDRVLMGLIPTCKEFLPRALSFLKRNTAGRPVGVIHYHYLADKPLARKTALDDVKEELGKEATQGMIITDLRCVKSYAPKRFHYVADLKFD